MFSLVMDELTKGIQRAITWCMLFADDVVTTPCTKPKGISAAGTPKRAMQLPGKSYCRQADLPPKTQPGKTFTGSYMYAGSWIVLVSAYVPAVQWPAGTTCAGSWPACVCAIWSIAVPWSLQLCRQLACLCVCHLVQVHIQYLNSNKIESNLIWQSNFVEVNFFHTAWSIHVHIQNTMWNRTMHRFVSNTNNTS